MTHSTQLAEALRELKRAINFKAACIAGNAEAEKMRFADECVWGKVDAADKALATYDAAHQAAEEASGEPWRDGAAYSAYRIERSIEDSGGDEHIAIHRSFLIATAKVLRAALAAPTQSVAVGDALDAWQPIETAPRSFHPPLSTVNHHAPDILGLWGQAFYCVCSWGGPSQPFWIGGDNKKVPFQPTHWQPLPAPPSASQQVAKP